MSDETVTFTERNMITGMCLWEAFLDLTTVTPDTDADEEGASPADGEDEAENGDDAGAVASGDDGAVRDAASEMVGDHGSFTIRSALVDLIGRCEAEWEAHVQREGDNGDQFDWDWCPRFIRAVMTDGTLDAAVDRQYGG